MRRTTRLLVATALAGILSPAALAQDATQGTKADQDCMRLSQLTEQNRERFRDDWVKEATTIVESGDAAECARYVEAAEKGIQELDSRQASSSDGQTKNQAGQDEEQSQIVVTQPQPNVTVQQDAPEVSVQQAQPQVTVRQPEPEIIVRQAQPTVRVQIPQPTITIDQPQPEIIVRMPEPEVGVTMAQPEVEVSQQQPQVRVEQAQPQVQVQMDEPEVAVQGEQQAEVQVERGQPVVRSTRPEEAQVNIQQAQPQVSYQQAEPKVEFETAGEPKVQFNTTGEPNIRVERTGKQAAAGTEDDRQGQKAMQGEQRTASTQADDQQAMQGEQQTADAQADGQQNMQQAEQKTATAQQQEVDSGQTASVDRQVELSDTAKQRLGEFDPNEAAGQMASIQVSQMIDKDVVNRQGEEIGTIERVVMRGDRHYVVLSHGGVLGLGEREVALPVDRLSTSAENQDQLILLGMTEDDLAELPEFDMNATDEVNPDQSVELRQG